MDDARQGGLHRTKEGPGGLNTASGLGDGSCVALAPPVLGEVVGTNDQVLRQELVAGRAVGRDNKFVTISEGIKLSRGHTSTVHLIKQSNRVGVVIITPKARGLFGKLIIL